MFGRIKKYFEDNLSPYTIGPHYVEDEMFPSDDEEQEPEKGGGKIVNFKMFKARNASQNGANTNQDEDSTSQMNNGTNPIDSGDSSEQIDDDSSVYSDVRKSGDYIVCTFKERCYIDSKTKPSVNLGTILDKSGRFARS